MLPLVSQFVVLRGVLTPAEVEACRGAIWHHREAHPEAWRSHGMSRDGGPIGESGRWQSGGMIDEHPGPCDLLFDHPVVLPFCRELMSGGPAGLCLTNAGAAIRDPVSAPAPQEGDPWP